MIRSALVALFLATTACGGGDAPAEKPAEAKVEGKVFFVSPADGATVTSPFKVEFGVEGLAVAPAGEKKDGTGHHHLIIDDAATPKGTVVAADEKHVHYGKGQTEAEITLAPGPHELVLQFANGLHESYGPELSAKIKITVAEAAPAAPADPNAPTADGAGSGSGSAAPADAAGAAAGTGSAAAAGSGSAAAH